MPQKPKLIVIMGPTAVGKTQLAVNLAAAINGEIISADSRQVYQHMNIGTGKDLDEYVFDNKPIKYHLIDIIPPGEQYNVHQFQQDFKTSFLQIVDAGHVPILCGGTGLYIQSVLQNFEFVHVPIDEKLRLELDNLSDNELIKRFEEFKVNFTTFAKTESRKRLIRAIEINEYLQKNKMPFIEKLDFEPVVFCINIPAEIRKNRITARLNARLQNGMIDEVHFLMKELNVSPQKLEYYGLEYKFVSQFLQGALNEEELFDKLNIAIHQFSKRQMTYFRKMEKDGIKIHWLDGQNSVETNVKQILSQI